MPEIKCNTLGTDTQLTVTFTDKPITAWGGLALFAQYAHTQGLCELLEKAIPFEVTSPNATNLKEIIIAFIAGVLTGARRFDHLERLRQDEVVKKLLGIHRFISPVSFGRFFKRFGAKEIEEMFPVLTQWVYEKMQKQHGIMDLDSSVIERYGKQEGAKRGYNPKKRGRPSHHPLIGCISPLGIIAHTWLRSGNARSARGAKEFLEELFALLPEKIHIDYIRADSGFSDGSFLDYLEDTRKMQYVIAARWTSFLQRQAANIKDWHIVDVGIEIAECEFQAMGWQRPRRVVVVKEDVTRYEQAKGKMLFDIPEFRYQAFITNISDKTSCEIWKLYRNRAKIENVIRELKYDYGIDGFCMHDFFATEAVFRMVCFVWNIMILMGKQLGALTHQALSTFRNQVFACGAFLGNTGGKILLRLSFKGIWQQRFLAYLACVSPSIKSNCVSVGTG